MARVLCIGIAVLDHIFKMEVMPTRAEKYRASDLTVVGGGLAGNAAVAVARQGGESWLITRLGMDYTAVEILAEFAAEGVNTSLSRRFSGIRSSMSAILVDRFGERTGISYTDPALPKETDWLPETLPQGVDSVLGDTRWEKGAAHLFELARAAGKPSVLDVDRRPKDFDIIKGASHPAFSAVAAREFTGYNRVQDAMLPLARIFPQWFAVTEGENGVFVHDKGVVTHVPGFKVDAVDTLGAGDTWHGAFALGLAEGQSEMDAIRYASAVAALKCTRFGGRAGIPNRAEVEAFLSAQ